jgi:hypothetical protein
VVPESRAAIIQALDLSEKYKNQVNQKHFRKLIHKRVLLIDIGSSTIDVTALDDLEAYEAKIGDDFGLRLVDQQLLKTLIKKHPERMKLKRRIEEDRRDERFLHYLCRLAKEHAFSRSVNPARFFEQREWAESCWSFLLRTDLSNCLSSPFFWEDEDSWLDRYRSLLQKLKNSEFFGRPDVLILTGGGSNIRQLLDEAISVFPAAVPARDPEPSLSVSRGLAGYGQWRKNVDAFYGDAITLVQSSKVESEISLEMIPFVSEVARILLESSVEAVWQPMAYKWKNEKLNINDQGGLVSYIVKLYREWLNNGNDILFKPSLDRLSDAANHALRDDIKKLSIRHGIPVDGFKIELRLLPNEFLMPISYGGGLLSKIAKGYQLYENLNFQLIDKAPNWLRKFCDSSGLLDFALESERIMKQILASVTASHYQTGVSPEIHESIIRFVRDAAKKEIDKQLHTVEKILLGGHKNLSNKVK